MKIICVLFIPKLRFRHSYHSEKSQHLLIDSNFFKAATLKLKAATLKLKAATLKQCFFILNDRKKQEINY